MKGFLYCLYLIVGALVGSLLHLYYSTGWLLFFFFLDFSSFFAFNGCIRWLFLSIFFVFIQGLSGTTFFELFSVSVFL